MKVNAFTQNRVDEEIYCLGISYKIIVVLGGFDIKGVINCLYIVTFPPCVAMLNLYVS